MSKHETCIGGIDLGGTKILSLCVDDELTILDTDRRETDGHEGVEAVIDRMVESMLAAAGSRQLRAVGVSMAGSCDPERGIVTKAPNLVGWDDIPLAGLISERLGVPVWLDNDANVAAVAEHRIGAGRESKHVILVAAGTGIGGGLVLDGKLYHGASGGAGEIGHMQLKVDGPMCGCGRRGCMEALASGWALGRDAADIVQREPDGILARLVRETGEEPDARLLELAADEGDVSAHDAIHQAALYLGAGLTNLVDIFNPQVIVIAGSLRKMGERYIGVAVDVMRREAYAQHAADVRILEAELGDEAPALGAAIVAREMLDHHLSEA